MTVSCGVSFCQDRYVKDALASTVEAPTAFETLLPEGWVCFPSSQMGCVSFGMDVCLGFEDVDRVESLPPPRLPVEECD